MVTDLVCFIKDEKLFEQLCDYQLHMKDSTIKSAEKWTNLYKNSWTRGCLIDQHKH